MTIRPIVERIALIDNEIEARTTTFQPARVPNVTFDENAGYFDHPSSEVFGSLDALRASVAPIRVPAPEPVPTGLRQHSFYALRGPSGDVADLAVTLIESGKTIQKLAFGSRQLRPSDYALAVFWTRRIGTPLLYTYLAEDRVNTDAGIRQNPHKEVRIGSWVGLEMNWSAMEGAESLRDRWGPSSFTIWYDEEAEAWISVRSRLPDLSSTTVARSLSS